MLNVSNILCDVMALRSDILVVRVTMNMVKPLEARESGVRALFRRIILARMFT
jgi:hypothetical protein